MNGCASVRDSEYMKKDMRPLSPCYARLENSGDGIHACKGMGMGMGARHFDC